MLQSNSLDSSSDSESSSNSIETSESPFPLPPATSSTSPPPPPPQTPVFRPPPSNGSHSPTTSSRPSVDISIGGVQGEGSIRSTSTTDELVANLQSFAQYDEKSDRFDDDVDQPLSAEEQRLMEEIESEQRADEELGRDATTRSALLMSPLLMALSSEVRSTGDNMGSFVRVGAPSPEPKSAYKSASMDYGMDFDSDESDSENEITEEDLRFGMREEPPEIEVESGETAGNDKIIPEDELIERRRRIVLIIGWTVAIVLGAVTIVFLVTRLGNRRSGPSLPPSLIFTRSPTMSPQPTLTPDPTESPSIRVSGTPTILSRTREPSVAPVVMTLAPVIFRQTPAPTLTLSPTSAPPIPQTIAPVVLATPAPVAITLSPATLSPITLSPITFSPNASPIMVPVTLPTVQPNDPPTTRPIPVITLQPTVSSGPPAFPTVEPSYSEEEVSRREQITALVVRISGVLSLLDPNSPQSLAYRWTMDDDPLQLMASDAPEFIQRYILATLYFATGGDNRWTTCGPPTGTSSCSNMMKRFLSGAPACMWLGITCNSAREIESINIRGNGLSGSLVPELGELSRLSTLSLSNNALNGTLPSDLTRLGRLRFLLLNGNVYTGSIPTIVGDLRSLWYLHLGSNRFEGRIPSEIFTASLQHLDLGDNRLVGRIPSQIYTISTNLLNIDLSNNQLTGSIPAGLGDYPNLSSFAVTNNTLSGTLPGSLISGTLTSLDVGTNNLRGSIPPDIYMFGTSLSFVNLGINGFEGTLSSRFGELTNLETLVFFFNDIRGTVPSAFGGLTNLETLHLSGTRIEGSMPTGVCDLRNGRLQVLSADCGGSNPEVQCSCCTFCYAGST